MMIAMMGMAFGQARDFQVMEIKRDGFIVQELKSVNKRQYTQQMTYTTNRNGERIYYKPRVETSYLQSVGGSSDPKITILDTKQYFILKNNNTSYITSGYKFNGNVEFVKLYEKDGKQIEILKLLSHKPFIDKNKNPKSNDPFLNGEHQELGSRIYKKNVTNDNGSVFKMARKGDPVNKK